MKKIVTVYTEGEPDREVEAECFYVLTIVMVIGGVEISKQLRGDTLEELEPERKSILGVSFIRYPADNGEYVEFLQNAIVFRQMEYVEELPERQPSQRERDHAEIEQSQSTGME